MTYLAQQKKTLRKTIERRIAGMPAEARVAQDAVLQAKLWNWLAPHRSTGAVLLAYWPLPDEPDSTPVLREWLVGGNALALPRITDGNSLTLHRIASLATDLEPGRHGIQEPHGDCPLCAPEEIGILLAPGRAFDAAGNRLGRGGGYYDRLRAQTSAPMIAVAYREQVVKSVPRDSHDQPVDVLLVAEDMC